MAYSKYLKTMQLKLLNGYQQQGNPYTLFQMPLMSWKAYVYSSGMALFFTICLFDLYTPILFKSL